MRPAAAGDLAPAPSRRQWVWLLVAVAGLLLFRLGDRGLNEPDEGRYTNIALGMLEPGKSILDPRMSDYGHYDKPPLTYWLTAVAFRTFGVNETAARLTPVFGAVLALCGIGWAAFRFYGARTAWWAVLMTATVGQFWLLARFLSPDMLLTGFTTLAIAAWAEARHRQGSWWWWSLSLLLWTAAWWTKATAALVPLLGLTVGLLARQDRDGLRALRPLRMLVAMILLGLPWYLDMVWEHPELKQFFLGREVVGRIAGHPDGRRAPLFFHVLVTLGAWLPWWPVALGALGWWLKRRRAAGGAAPRWRTWPLEIWITLTGLAVFSVISSKLPTYTLPFAPWAALFGATVWQRLADEGRGFASLRGRLFTAGGFAVAYLAVALAQPLIESRAGRNSSVRQLAGYLKQQGAQTVYLDRYWPGMEFYFGEHVHFVVPAPPRQRVDDLGLCSTLGEPHFVRPDGWLKSLGHHAHDTVWLVSLRQTPQTPLLQAAALGELVGSNRVGDFVLWRLEWPRTARH